MIYLIMQQKWTWKGKIMTVKIYQTLIFFLCGRNELPYSEKIVSSIKLH